MSNSNALGGKTGAATDDGPVVIRISRTVTSRRRTGRSKVRISVGHGIEHGDTGHGGLCALNCLFLFFRVRNAMCGGEVEKTESGKEIVFCSRIRKSDFLWEKK